MIRLFRVTVALFCTAKISALSGNASHRSGSATGNAIDRRSMLQISTASAVAGVLTNQASPARAAALAPPGPPSDALLKAVGGKPVLGAESIMSQKEHGTSSQPVQSELLYGVSNQLADKICNYNRHFAEMGGSFRSTNWEDAILAAKGKPVAFYDSVTGKPLFVAPIGRSAEELLAESETHGWPSFRDEEVVWDNVRVLRSSGETVSVDGTHLGHNLPDRSGNRYCINLVSIAGQPANQA